MKIPSNFWQCLRNSIETSVCSFLKRRGRFAKFAVKQQCSYVTLIYSKLCYLEDGILNNGVSIAVN